MPRIGWRLWRDSGIRVRAGAGTLMSDAGLRLGATLDLTDTARRIIDISIPRFAGTAAVFVLEKYAAGEPAGRAGPGQIVARRLMTGLLPNGRSALIVGDAMGHGAEAATVMAQLGAAANALAVLATPDGKTEVIDIPAGLPLGLGAETFGVVEVPLPPGAVLALYTDGLVESRVRPFDEGVEALRDALAGCQGPLPGICDAVVGKLWERGEDDTTLVLARIPSVPAPRIAPA